MSEYWSLVRSVASAISAVNHMASEALATAALEKKVKDSTICIAPVHHSVATPYEWKEGRKVGFQVFTRFKDVDEISRHSSHDALYSLHLQSKEFSGATKEAMTDDDRLLHWATHVKAHMMMCGERAKEVTVITKGEAKRLVALKSSKWYEAKEPWKEHGAI
jgi:hypothetical protein